MFLLLAAERKNNLYVIKNRVIRRLRDFADNWQLFYKAGDDAHIQKMEAFKEQLREWARLLRLRNMKFLILSVPITNADEVERRYGHLVKHENARIFEDMKLETIYRFDFDSIEVEDVLAGKEE